MLGGGGIRGAVEVGQVQAILEAGVTPDLVVGTSIGAINGALIAQTLSIESRYGMTVHGKAPGPVG